MTEHMTGERTRLRDLARKHYHTKLIRGFTHELNNYMTGILGFSQLILEIYEIDESMKEELKEIERSAIRSRDAIKQISKLWRSFEDDAGGVHLATLFHEIQDSCRYYLDKKGILLFCESSSGDVYVKAREEDLEDAFYSLILATILGIPDNSEITITLSREGSKVSVGYEVRSSFPGVLRKMHENGPGGTTAENTYLWAFYELIGDMKGTINTGSGEESLLITLPADE